ncbi:MAG: S9 family peptidase [Candidatus Korarchaeota archaeon]|nr:S9 family peptidase [Candidatus Korarchaeota archaeon]NIU83155.1 prolyl oligopeptidase family serine peptidase [Candidatus Thorarchaeota archaeon]NIW13529.1 prolyl oligopeptidase family serine peptidase [Candidatus Thorarchaeota archaeon]NIW51629.1 prolyl oligopeptidase family serine peptidase [Candidatus Korarchaeota archaeon]
MSERIETEDIFDFIQVQDPQLSPDGKKIAFTVVRPSLKENTYHSNIWLYDRVEKELFPLTKGENDSFPRWSPSGSKILFLSRRKKDDEEEGNELWILDAKGRGEPSHLLTRENGISSPEWSPLGGKILFLSRSGEKQEEVQIIEHIPIWRDAIGYTHHAPMNAFEVNTLNGRIKQLTRSDTDLQSVAYSHSGEKIAFLKISKESKPDTMELCVSSSEGRDSKTIANNLSTFYPITWDPNDECVLFTGHRFRTGHASHNDLWRIPIDGQEPENLTRDFPKNIRGGYLPPQAPVWEGQNIYFINSDGGKTVLSVYNVQEKKLTHVIDGKLTVGNFSIKNGVIAYQRETDTTPGEVYVRDEHGNNTQLTHFNDDLLEDKQIHKPKHFSFTSSDGEEVEGWVIQPKESVQGKIPTILAIHGGPKGQYGYSFQPEFQYLASLGYGVLFTNPRGSDGYTEKFADLREGYGERDYEDIMEAVDYAISEFNWIDEDNMGVTGGSYGGYMTNWIVTQTDRFKAAIAEESISNWLTKFSTTDIGFAYNKNLLGGDPWENRNEYLKKSPITFAPQVTTPLLLVHAKNDYRCWVDQAIQFYQSLKYLGKEAKLLLFPSGSHGLRRTGKPEYRKQRLEEITKWLDEHLR